MNNLVMTDEWCRYVDEAPSCGATLRIFEDSQKKEFILFRADPWTGEFNDEIYRSSSFKEAVDEMYREANSL